MKSFKEHLEENYNEKKAAAARKYKEYFPHHNDAHIAKLSLPKMEDEMKLHDLTKEYEKNSREMAKKATPV